MDDVIHFLKLIAKTANGNKADSEENRPQRNINSEENRPQRNSPKNTSGHQREPDNLGLYSSESIEYNLSLLVHTL